MKDVARLASVHPNSIRRATDSGALSCLRLPSGARRFRLSDVQTWLGIRPEALVTDDGETAGKIPIAKVLRVSSKSQAAKTGGAERSSLEHQEARLDAFLRNRWGNNCEVTCYKRVAGGLDLSNVVFIRLIDDILAQKFAGGFVVCQDPSRLARMAHALLEHIAKIGRTEIVYLMDEETAQKKTDNEELADELLMIITSYTARASGRKAKEFLQIRVQPPVINRIFDLQRIGYSTRTIALILEREGLGQAENGTITRHVVARILRDKSLAKVIRKADASPAISLHSFEKFVAARLKLSSAESKLSFKTMQSSYLDWCQLNGLHRFKAQF